MTPPSIETSTDARSKSRVELAPTMPCKKEEDQRSTDARSKSRVELAPTMPCKKEEDQRSTRAERQAYVREKWECMHNCELCGKCHILKGRDAETLYADYIEGKRSYMEITLEIRK